MKPVVGISLSDKSAEANLFLLAVGLGMRVMFYEHDDRTRWRRFIDTVGREAIACVIDDDPQMVVTATSLGVHAVAFNPPPYFSWHLTIRDSDGTNDAQVGLAYRLKEWKDRHATDQT